MIATPLTAEWLDFTYRNVVLALPNVLVTGGAAIALHGGWTTGLAACGVLAAASWPGAIVGLRLAERVHLLWHGIRYVCPSCSADNKEPAYMCGTCFKRIEHLGPSWSGLRHRVHDERCGRLIPTTIFDGKHRLNAFCRACNAPMSLVLARGAHVPIVGTASSGKSQLVGAIATALDGLERSGDIDKEYPDEASRNSFERIQRLHAMGELVPKTPVGTPPALMVHIKKDQAGQKVTVHMYDAAGELFGSGDRMRSELFLGLTTGTKFVVDPEALLPGGGGPAKTLAVAGRLIDVLTDLLGKERASALPIAVVVSKSDLRGVGDTIQCLVAAMGPAGPDTESRAVRGWLEAAGLGSLVVDLEAAFKHVRYFCCSALGRAPDQSGTAYRPDGVLSPLAWILAHHGIDADRSQQRQARRTNRWLSATRWAAAGAVVAALASSLALGTRYEAGQLLLEAAAGGNAPVVDLLALTAPDIDICDGAGNTGLMNAAAKGHRPGVQAFLRAGARTGLRNKAGQSALHQAVLGGHRDVVADLLAAGAPVDQVDAGGTTSLVLALVGGDTPIARLLLVAGAAPTARSRAGDAATVLALGAGDPVLAKEMLVRGASGADRDRRGMPLLFLAFQFKAYDVAAEALRRGASPDAPDTEGRSPAVWAVLNGDLRALACVRAAGAHLSWADRGGRIPLLVAYEREKGGRAGGGERPFVRALLAAGASPDARDGHGDPLLVLAVKDSDATVARLTLGHGARVDARGANNLTALFWAVKLGRAALVQPLLAQRANPHVSSPEGAYPLGLAAASREAGPTLRRLLGAGARPDWRPEGSPRALEVAIVYDNLPAVHSLYEAGAYVAPGPGGARALLRLAREANAGAVAGFFAEKVAERERLERERQERERLARKAREAAARQRKASGHRASPKTKPSATPRQGNDSVATGVVSIRIGPFETRSEAEATLGYYLQQRVVAALRAEGRHWFVQLRE